MEQIWPLQALPRVIQAGRYYHDDRGHRVRYLSPQDHVLHLYDYPAQMCLDGQMLELERGDVTFSPSGRATTYDLPRPGHHWCIHFLLDCSVESEPAFALPLHTRLTDRGLRCEQKFLEVIQLHAAAVHSPLHEQAASITLQQLLIWLRLQYDLGHNPTDSPRQASAVDRALAYIDSHLGQPISIPRLA